MISEKNMRNGRHAFPQLREFHRLPDLKGETLFDNFTSVLSANHKHLWCNYKDKFVRKRMATIRSLLLKADRFVISSDLQKLVADISWEATDDKIFDVFNNAIPPFDNMWIETERNPRAFRIDGGGDGYLEQCGWHITRNTYHPTDGFHKTAVAEDVICITKYIKFTKTETDKLFENAGLDFKLKKLPHDGGGAYYISDLSVLIAPNTVPEYLVPKGWSRIVAPRLGNKGSPLACLGEQWQETIENGQPHIKRNLSARIGVSSSLAVDLSHSLVDKSALTGELGDPFVSSADSFLHDSSNPDDMFHVFSASWGQYEDDIRILAWALADFNYNWIVKDPAPKPKRRNRCEPLRLATIDHRTIEVDLPKPRGKEMGDQQYGDGTPRKWHKVRGHWRLYRKTGKRVWVESHERGSKKLGEVHKDYRLTAAYK